MCHPSQVPLRESQKLKWLDCPLKEHEAFAQSSQMDSNGEGTAPTDISTWTRQGQGRMLWAPQPNPRLHTHLNTQHTQPPPQIPCQLPESNAVLAVGAEPTTPTHFHATHLSIPTPSPGGVGPPLALCVREPPWRYLEIRRAV